MNSKQVKKSIPIRKLLAKAEALGLRVRFTNEAIYGWAFGSYNQETKVLEVCLRRPDGKFFGFADVAFILAHEIRHAIHVKRRLFRPYYNDKYRVLSTIGIRSPHLFKTAWAAELDCDKYAKKYVSKHFFGKKSMLINRYYPAWRVHPAYLPVRIYNKRLSIDRYYKIKKLFGSLAQIRRIGVMIK